MKKIMAVLLVILLSTGILSLPAQAITLQFSDEQLALSPNEKCPVRPQIYSNPRYKNADSDKAYDVNSGLSAKKINEQMDRRFYGLYFKFTPSGRDNGYMIWRFDVVVTDKNGQRLYIDGFDSEMECTAGYYWSWDFFPLEALFDNMRMLYGEVIPGNYKMDVYFNRLWAGSTSFKINK